jgi:hypothetical protein
VSPARNVSTSCFVARARDAGEETSLLLWLFLALILVTAPPLLIVGWLQIQHMRKHGPLKARQIIVLIIVLVPAVFFGVQLIWMFVWFVAAMFRSMMFQ